ncbi:MAG: type II toxin-antitoxin system VapC family toxin [Candidatus Bathyarchaeota archaeon]|nr:type II toxin-antitoxin system VapC family toxin [Candidatus Bathyarchaeota archaeon]
MVTEVVVDSSVIIAIVIPEEHSDWALKKISEHTFLHILDFSYYEVANAIKCKAPNKLTVEGAEKAFTKALEIMNLFGVHSFGEVIVDAMNLALEYNIAVYDASFLSLADNLDIRLLTLDFKLAKRFENSKFRGLIEYPNKHSTH